jgi:nucleoside transporter
MKTKTYISLAVMMFLEFFIWGVWYVSAGSYLTAIGFEGAAIGRAFSTLALGSIISAFFVSLIADRYFAAQKLNGVLHILGGLLMFLVSGITNPGLFFWVLLLYMICYMPTVALSSTVALRHTPNAGRQFPWIRVWGTFGWVVGGLLISLLDVEKSSLPMVFAAVASFLLGIYSFFLPSTPPQKTEGKVTFSDVIGLDALKLMKNRSFAILIIATLLIAIPFAMYFQYANMSMNEKGIKNVAGLMSMGQMSEVIFMLLMPFIFVRLGIKRMLLVGMFAWAIRYVLFAFGNNAELVSFFYIGIILHGVCYDFFYVSAQIYVDRKAPANLRASTQGLLTFITYGVGWFIGTTLSGWELQRSQIIENGQVVNHNWQSVMLVPAAIAFVIAILFILFFKDEKDRESLRMERLL